MSNLEHADTERGPTDASSPAKGTLGETFQERFVLGEVISEGPRGGVRKAWDRVLGRNVLVRLTPAADAQRNELLLASARSMARLKDARVVPVFDIGTHEGAVYVVMPLVQGGTLEDWLRSAPRSWREIVSRFVSAGRGLATAHGAGLVDGKFDPQEVFVDGAATLLTHLQAVPAEDAAALQDDVRQFCVHLDVALRDSDAPTRLREAIEQGRSSSTLARTRTMSQLVDFLEARLRRRKRVALAGVVGAVVIATLGAIVVARGGDDRDSCALAGARVQAVWSAEAQVSMRRSFSALASPAAEETLERVTRALDAYAKEWQAAAIATCRASGRVAQEATPGLIDQRRACLERRLAALRARTDAFSKVDASIARDAVRRTEELPSIADCLDDEALARVVDLPGDAAARRRISDLQGDLDDVERLEVAGDSSRALARAKETIGAARALGYAPVHLRALQLLARLETTVLGEPEPWLRELATSAAHAKDDAAMAYAWIHLIRVLMAAGKPEEAASLESVAAAAVKRAPQSHELRYQLAMSLGNRAGNAGDPSDASAHFRVAVAEAPTPGSRAAALKNLGFSLLVAGKTDEAVSSLDEALSVAADVYGTHHPAYAAVLDYYAIVLMAREDLDGAMKACQQVLAIRESAFGQDHGAQAETLTTMGNIEARRGNYEASEQLLRRSLAILREHPVPQSLPNTLLTLAEVIYAKEGFEPARPVFLEALEESRKIFGDDSIDTMNIEQSLASALVNDDDCASAIPYATHVFAVLDAAGSPYAGTALFTLGRCDVRAGRRAQGLARMEKGYEQCRKGCEPAELADLEKTLADYRTRDARRASGSHQR